MGSHPRRVIPATDPEAVDQAVAVLRSGELIGIPTETVYGIAALPADRSLERLLSAKRRAPDKGIAVLVDALDQVAELVSVPAGARLLAARLWPGPLTLVLPIRADARVSPLLTGGRDTLGVRLPDHPVPRAIAARVGPVAASSANRSGEPDAQTAGELLATVGDALTLVIDGGRVIGGTPSTVVAVSGDGQVTVLRAGAIPAEAIEAALA